jgi:hypothetical protein
MGARQLQNALERLRDAMHDVDSVLNQMRSEHDPLALHIFVSRRHYRAVRDTKSGKRRDTTALVSYREACDFGFRGSLSEWESLMGAVAKR